MTSDEPRTTTVYFACRQCQGLVKSQTLANGETREEGHRRGICQQEKALV